MTNLEDVGYGLAWVKIVLVLLATYRLSMLVTRDAFPFGRLRQYLVRNYSGSIVELFQCPWCVSMYLGAGVTVLSIYCWSWFAWCCLVFSASGVAGFLAEHS